MYSLVKLGAKYLKYWLTAENGKGHGIHSPFVYDFVTKVLNDFNTYYCYEPVEALRKKLKQDDTVLTLQDFGAGSRVHASYHRKISAIANSSLKPRKFAQLLFRIINHYQPKNILELGTSLGITTAYLASANNNIPVITMEGAAAVAAIAQKNFLQLNIQNITVVEGNFDETLDKVLNEKLPIVDFAFIDGNHRKDPTIAYFTKLLPHIHEHSILVFDDIHWSEEMEAAWNLIKQHTAVTLAIDLFFIGIVFFRSEQKTKEDFVIRF